MEKNILYIYKTEVELIKSVIDLAASRRVPINSRGEYDEWLSFDSITEALDDICEQINVDRQVEQHCYQTLLRMSAESEKHLTWWEKIAMIHRYLPHHTHGTGSKHSPSNIDHHHQQASKSHKSLPTPVPHLMRLVEPEKATLIRPSNIPTTSPGTLLEINNLSMLLNDTYGFQSKHELQRNKPSTAPDSGLYVRRNLATQDIHTSRGNITFADTTTPVRTKDSMYNFNEQGWMSHIGPSSSARRIHFQDEPATPDYDHLQRHAQPSEGLGNKEYLLSSVMEKVSSIEKETQLTKDILSGMYRKSHVKSDSTGTRHDRHNDTTNPAEQTPTQNKTEPHKVDRGDWTLSPSVIHNMSTVADTPMANAAPSAKVSNPVSSIHAPAAHTHLGTKDTNNAQSDSNQPSFSDASEDTTYQGARTKSRAFSDLLRHSSAMSKYMGLGTGLGAAFSSPRRAQSVSPSRQPVPPTPPARDDADLGRSSAPRRSSVDAVTTTPEVSQSSRKKVLFDSPAFSPPTHHRSGQVGSRSAPAEPVTPRSSFAARYPATFATATPSRVVPLALQGKHGAGGLYTPEGHIDLNALDFDARVLHSQAAYANSTTGMDLSADLSHTIGSAEGLVDTITSTTRILIIFHRWLLRRSDHNNVHFDDDRNAALMLICHFDGMNNFVTSLFGLEQWLRDKMKLIVRTEAKAFVFRTWNLKYGVSAKSREFWRRRRLHFGFESFLEYGMKRRMHRKNALHALAARRRHANSAHMAPILRHRPPRSNLNNSTSHIVSTVHFSDEENEPDSKYSDSSSVLSPQMSRLSDLDKLNKYSNLDMSMLHMEKRHRAKQAQYFTSLSIRDILNDTKSALVLYSRGGTNAHNLRAKTQEYVHAQDTVALLFAFRRFYHRAIYITRQRKLRQLRRKQRLSACLAIWKAMYAERARSEQALQPQVEFALEEMKFARKRIALRKLKRFVLYSQRDSARKARYAARIRSKQIYLRAFHALRCAAYVKCFDVLKSNYIKNSPTVEELRHSAFHQQFYSVQSAFKGWRRWLKSCAATRLNGFQSQVSRQLLMTTLLQKSHIRHLVQDTRHSHHHHHSSGGGRNNTINMSPDTFFSLPFIRELRLKPSLLKHTAQLIQLKRAMRRLKQIGRCARVFFALSDLRTAQSMGHRNVASDRLKCAQHVTESSCRILPSSRDHKKNNNNKAESARDGESGMHHMRTRRAGSEKPFKLIGVNPHTFGLFMRTLFHSTPLERHELDSSFSGQAIRSHRSAHLSQSLVLMDGTKLSAAPQLLRFTRKWRVLCSERSQLRKVCDKVRRARALAVLKTHYEEWQKAFKQERMCNQCNKRRALQRFRAFRQRNRHAHKVHKKTRRDLVIRHWQRLAAAHLHHTELRRLQAGHFYNAVMDGSSRRVLDFVAKHDFVPFSVRHFLSHFPSYRFPIYRQYDEAFWDHARHTDAHQALVMISQHHEAYTHDRHVTHHLELFQHHHHPHFQTSSAARRDSDPAIDSNTRPSQPHTYATPSHHSTFVQNSKLYQSPNRPLHLTPGAMLSDQAFSVSAAIASSKYGRNGSLSPTSRGRGRSSSPQKSNNGSKLSLQTSFDAAQDQTTSSFRTASGVHSSSYGLRAQSLGEVPAASELASAAMFMSHWISECLQQYYTLRRALRNLRHFGRLAGRRTRKLYNIALSKQRLALAAFWQNRRDRQLIKQVRHLRLRDYSLKLRAVTVYLKARKRILRKIVEFMCQTHRHNLVVRTWQNRWNNVMRSAWDKLTEHTKLRTAQFTRVRNTQDRIRTTETVRIMCGVVTANSWRRRHAKVIGLRNFVQNYNRSVLAMDRDNTVQLAAHIKQFAILKENLLGKLKQRLSDVVGMNYRKKSALISGFMALYCAVQQPQRHIDEATLKDRMYASIDVLRESHHTYVTHQFRPGSDIADIPIALRQRQQRKMRHQETMTELRASTSPYVSTVLPLPSPLPPAHTISTTVRRASMLRESGRQRATIDTLSENNPHSTGAGGGLSVNTSVSGAWSPQRGSPRGGSAAHILFGSVGGTGRSPYPMLGSALDDFLVLTGTKGPSTRASSMTLSAMAQRRRSAANSARTPNASVTADSRGSVYASTYRSAAGNISPFSVSGRRSTAPSPGPSTYGTLGGFRNSVESSKFGYSMGSTANSVVSNVSNYSTSTKRSSLHDAHAAVLSAPTTAPPSQTLHTDADPLDISLRLPSARPQSILITSPAYVGSARQASRADSRIFFSTSPTSGPASVASARSNNRRSSVSVQQPISVSSNASRRFSAPPSNSSNAGNRELSLMPPFSPLTPHDSREDGNFFDDASTDASTMFTTDTPRGGGGNNMRVQRRRSSVHQQRSEETAEQLLQLERAQKLYIFRRWINELQAKKALRRYYEEYHLRQLVSIHFLRMHRQTRIDRHQRLQLNRVAAHRALTRLNDMCARNVEYRQILEFSEKYYLVMALKLNLRKWRARVKRRTLNRYDAVNAKTFNKRRAFMKFMINLRAICTQLPLPGESADHHQSVGRYDSSPNRARSNFSATEWKHHSPSASRSSSYRANKAMSSSHSGSTHRLRRHQSPLRNTFTSPRRTSSPYSSPHQHSGQDRRGTQGYREHKHAQQYHVHYADDDEVLESESRLFRSAGALTKRSIASILNK